jgi:hypothetical protein
MPLRGAAFPLYRENGRQLATVCRQLLRVPDIARPISMYQKFRFWRHIRLLEVLEMRSSRLEEGEPAIFRKSWAGPEDCRYVRICVYRNDN